LKNADILDSVLQQAGEKLFETYGLHVKGGGRPETVEGLSIRVVAVLGFTGAELRGSVMLALSEEALMASRQTKDARAQDWIAELANQLVGRIKNQLLGYGTEIALSTPLVIRGDRISPCMKGDQAPLVWSFEEGVGYAWLDCEVVEGFQLVLSEAAPTVAEEGASFVF
jgi:CheY-specific phosphatase CheX